MLVFFIFFFVFHQVVRATSQGVQETHQLPTVGGGGGAGRDPFTGMSTVKLPGVFRATNLVPQYVFRYLLE